MTRGSHPPALLRRTERTLREETPLRRGQRVLVAVSGGGDSMALLHVLARLGSRLGIELFAHGVDHGLRAAAAAELALAATLASELGVPFTSTALQLAPGGNLQARARAARYAALDAAAERVGADWVATAHHADDRAETLLLRLLRGASPSALGVLPAAAERRLRPFIRAPKSAISQHLQRHGVPHAHDPSNRDPRFLRTRIREELLPLLERLTPGAARRLNLLADECWELQPTALVTDAQGHAVRLSRTQSAQIRRAHKLGQPGVRIWLAGGQELEITEGLESRGGAHAGGTHPAASLRGGSSCAETPSETQYRLYVGENPGRSRKKPRSGREKPAERGAKPTKSD
jgi:tRNA(Ile)-lysidine synthase